MDSLIYCDADDGMEDDTTEGTWFRDTEDAESDKVQLPVALLSAVSAYSESMYG